MNIYQMFTIIFFGFERHTYMLFCNKVRGTQLYGMSISIGTPIEPNLTIPLCTKQTPGRHGVPRLG